MPGGGASGGQRIHFFAPDSTTFHADDAFGSMCQLEPERVPPAMSQRWSGRQAAGSASKRSRSGAKKGGGAYSAASGGAFAPNLGSNCARRRSDG